MSSFLSRFKPGAPSSSTAANAPTKKDPNAPHLTPLEKLLADAGPIRPDGSDKFFGFENFGSTCYCNSIIQCLYYSVPFRDQVINFPSRSPPDILNRPRSAVPRIDADTNGTANGSATKGKADQASSTPASPRKGAGVPGGTSGTTGSKPEDNKDSPEYKKKQAMASGPILNMDYENANAYGMSLSLFTALKDIFEAVIAHRSRMGVVSPQKFLEILRQENEMFRTAMHQDAHEFLNLLLNEVVENVEKFGAQPQKRLEDGSDTSSAVQSSARTSSVLSTDWIHSLFEGELTSETRCLTCETKSHRAEVFLDLSVDLDQHSSVTSCLRKFSEEEMLCERNKFHCDKCGGLQEAEKRMKVRRLPRILALHLKRFKYTEDLQRLQKLFHRVVYPYHLRLFNTTDDSDDPDRLYELYAVVVHIGGGPYHGHYVSIIKTADRGWLLFDDEMVEPVDRSYVRNFFGGDNALACAYVLFYQETTPEAVEREEAEAAAAAEAGMKAPADAAAHPVTPGVTPRADDVLDFAHLSHTATAPPTADPHTPAPATPHHPLEHTVTEPLLPSAGHPAGAAIPPTTPIAATATTPTTPLLPAFLTHHTSSTKPSAAEAAAKKERAREEKARKETEKARKAAEKARAQEERGAEKAAKHKRKELEQRRRDTQKKQSEDYLRAIKASKASKAEEDKKRGGGGGGGAAEEGELAGFEPPTRARTADENTLLHPTRERERGKEGTARGVGGGTEGVGGGGKHPVRENGGLSAGLSRFRHSSMSLRHKPRFWPGKDGAKDHHNGGSEHHDHHHDQQHQQQSDTADDDESDDPSSMTALPLSPPLPPPPPTPHGQHPPPEGKNRFSLGKKVSALF